MGPPPSCGFHTDSVLPKQRLRHSFITILHFSTSHIHTPNIHLEGEYSHRHAHSAVYISKTHKDKIPIVFVLLPTLLELPDFFLLEATGKMFWKQDVSQQHFVYVAENITFTATYQQRDPQHFNDICITYWISCFSVPIQSYVFFFLSGIVLHFTNYPSGSQLIVQRPLLGIQDHVGGWVCVNICNNTSS